MGIQRRRGARRIGIAALAAIATLSTLLTLSATAGPAPGGTRRSVLDHVVDSRIGMAITPGAATTRARVALAKQLGSQGLVIADPLTGTLRMLGRLDGFLTDRSSLRARQVAMRYVRAHLPALGLSRADLHTFRLRDDYVDILGTHHLSWTQSSHGITVFQNGLKANVTKDGRLINLTGSPVHGPWPRPTIAQVSASGAIASARRSAGTTSVARSGDTAGLVLFPTPQGLRLAWRTVTGIAVDETDLSVVDAGSGRLLWRANLTKADTGTAVAWGFYPSDLVPNGGGLEQPVTFPVNDGTKLSGNNAHVWADIDDDSKAEASEEIPAVAGSDWTFPGILNTTDASQNCSPSYPCTWDKTTPFSWRKNMTHYGAQYYYYLNTYHDHLLASPIGFTEAAGNFQVTNSSGQGLGGDPVLGHILDGADTNNGVPDSSHLNNAFMSTLPDGQSPTMGVYLIRQAPYWQGANSNSAGDDASWIYHEYTHGLVGRLLTYPDGFDATNSFQAGAMNEGMADWYANGFLNTEGYLADGPTVGDVVDGPWFTQGVGDRSQPEDCVVGSSSPLCPDLGNGAGAGGYTYGDLGKVLPYPEVHEDGQIWTQTLWDLRRTLGANTAEALVTRGLELSPPDPSFLDLRNAIIQADLVVSGGSQQDAIWNVFAHRGMGYFASSIDGNDVHPVEDSSLPVDCASSACGAISGTIRDDAGDPVAGAVVGIAGHTSGLPSDLADVTDDQGHFSIRGVPFHDYASFVVDKTGYEPSTVSNLVVDGDETVNRTLSRDWAALEGGAKLVKASPPDYSDFGCGPTGAFDLSLASGWGSDSPGPRSIVVKLPEATDVTSFGFDPGNTCGDGPDAATKTFAIYTKQDGGSWVLAYEGKKKLKPGRLHTLKPTGGTADVRFVKLVLLTNRGDSSYMDMSELTVRGT